MPVNQNFLLRYYARTKNAQALEFVYKTLKAMSHGGIYDQVGGGFHRYSVDSKWRVPHFEKMLYDNAQLAVNYLELYQATKDLEMARVAKETIDYILRDMTHPQGGFYSAEDADSLPPEHSPRGHGEEAQKTEGAFYLWTEKEIFDILGIEAGESFIFRYGVNPQGNALEDPHGEFKSKNILYVEHSLEETAARFGQSPAQLARTLNRSRESLLIVRSKRPRPGLDDKIPSSWNGLMLSALAKGYQVLEEERYLEAAQKAISFTRANLYDAKTKKLYHRWRDGERAVLGMADDYAFLVQGLLDVYEASFNLDALDWALELTLTLQKDFYDAAGGYYMTPSENRSDLLLRMVEDSDNVEPAASSVAVLNLLRLAQYTQREDLHKFSEQTLLHFGSALKSRPRSLPQMLVALDFLLTKPKQIIIAGEKEDSGTREMLRLVHERFMPVKMLMVMGQKEIKRITLKLPMLAGMVPIEGKSTAYVCLQYACELPTNDIQVMSKLLDAKK